MSAIKRKKVSGLGSIPERTAPERTDIDPLKKAVAEKALKNPEKSAKVLQSWIRQDQEKKTA